MFLCRETFLSEHEEWEDFFLTFTVFQDHRTQVKFNKGTVSKRQHGRSVGFRASRINESVWVDSQSVAMGSPRVDGMLRFSQAGLKKTSL